MGTVRRTILRLLGFALRYAVGAHLVIFVGAVIATWFTEGTAGLLPMLADLKEWYVELWLDGFDWAKNTIRGWRGLVRRSP